MGQFPVSGGYSINAIIDFAVILDISSWALTVIIWMIWYRRDVIQRASVVPGQSSPRSKSWRFGHVTKLETLHRVYWALSMVSVTVVSVRLYVERTGTISPKQRLM